MTLPIEHPSGLSIRQPDMSLARPTRWAWQHRIAVGYLNLLVGDEGIGKGVLAAWLIARLRYGDLPGNFRHEPVMVGIVADEDSFNDVWTPRLYAVGADLSFVRHIEHPQEGYLNLSNDREALEIAVDLDGFKVVYFDQLLDNLDALVDEYKQKAVRHALRPLRRIGRDFDIAVLAGLHPNKRAGSFFLTRLDEARGGIPRSTYVRTAVEAWMGAEGHAVMDWRTRSQMKRRPDYPTPDERTFRRC